ncbi:hypothetical protein ACOSP7_013024 [Xanthoceras sorbifolium]
MSHHEPEVGQKTVNGSETIIKPRGLHIVWGRDSRYWQLPEQKKEGKEEEDGAELKQVCWLEITGSVDVEGGKTYAIEFIVSMKEDAFGWSDCPVFMMAKAGKRGKYNWKKINSLDQKITTQFSIPDKDNILRISLPNQETKLFFGLYEVWSGKWKGGLIIHKAIITEISSSSSSSSSTK